MLMSDLSVEPAEGRLLEQDKQNSEDFARLLMPLMIERGELAQYGHGPIIKNHSRQSQPRNVGRQHLSPEWIQGSPRPARCCGGIILVFGVTQRPARIHDTGLPLSPDIEVLWMIQSQGM